MKGKSKSKNSKRKYAKPISLYPLKPEEALSAFMKVDPKKIREGSMGRVESWRSS